MREVSSKLCAVFFDDVCLVSTMMRQTSAWRIVGNRLNWRKDESVEHI